jgi:CRP/FNR family cyclic AMP-dependent transcriptional regulator
MKHQESAHQQRSLARIEGEELDYLEEFATRRSFAKDSIIINEGDEALALYVVQSGRLKIFITTEAGKEIILKLAGPGDYFGELAMLDGAPRSASVKAIEPCELLVLPRAKLHAWLAKYPHFHAKLLKDLSLTVRQTTDELKRIASMDVYQRIAKLLRDLATEDGDRLVVHQRLTQQELANRICASREMVSRVLQGLVVGGYITLDRRQIVINKKLPERW